MSLLDLKSDLSKFRYNAPKPTTTLPKSSQTRNSYDNNFGSYKPITDGLIDNRPGVRTPSNIDLVGKLKDTKLDDTIKNVFQEVLINAVSEYSPKNIETNFGSPSRVPLENIVSSFSRISKDVVQSSINKSDVVIARTQQGTNNNQSNVEVIDNGSEVGNIVNPNVTLNNIPLTYERQRQSPDLTVNPDDATDNIQNPDVTLNNIPLTYNREGQSVDLDKGFSSREFIVNASSNKLLSDSILNIDRTPEKYRTQSRIENREITEKVDTTRYNGQISDLAISDSILDLTNPEQTVLSGRHETDKNSSLSNSKDSIVDYFDNTNADGFTKKIQPLQSEYVNNSSNLGYETILEANYFDITNQYTTDGFEAFAVEFDSKYKPDASAYDWDGVRQNAPVVNYFDDTNKFTKSGFTSFAQKFITEYKTDSSEFDWDGVRQNAPRVNYFDLTGANTKEGFHTFAVEYDSKYVNESSRFDWDGTPQDAPEVNYFDRIVQFTTEGFHKFAQIYDTKYIPESSQFDWDGVRADAPTNDINNPNGYFDITNQSTWRGFHTFATPLEATSYTNTAQGQPVTGPGVTLIGGLLGSTQFDWDGIRSQAPTNDINNPNGYFDSTNRFTWRGFHTFAVPLEATSYTNTAQGQPVATSGVTLIGGPIGAGTTDFDWDGTRNQAPTNDINNPNGYFDITNQHTWRGFHTFAAPLEATSYRNTAQGQPVTTSGVTLIGGLLGSTQFDWDGTRNQAPTNDINNPNGYFDITNRFTWRGFHTFAAPLEATSYTNTAQGQPITTSGVTLIGGPIGAGTTDFDWDGIRSQAPTNDANNPNGYFDITNRFTWRGFHTFAVPLEATSYTNTAQGQPITTSGVTLIGGPIGAGTTDFDWDGVRSQAPTNDANNPNGYFDITNQSTWRGFHTFATPLEPTSYTNTAQGQPVTGPGVTLIGGLLGSTQFDWDGTRNQAPTNDINNPNGYFDITNRFTWRGFHTFALPLEPTSYTNTAQGQPVTGPGVTLIGGLLGSTQFDWDGTRNQAPTNDINNPNGYFDITNRFTWRGFHTFALPLEPTSYTNTNQGQPVTTSGVTLIGGPIGVGTTDFDWDGVRSQAPTNDANNPNGYFDITNQSTWRGFHTFATPLEPTSYTNTAQGQPVTGPGVTLIGGQLGSTQFDWDGLRNQAPTNDINNPNGYFDITNRFTWRGFHTFATPLEATSYTNTNQGQPIAGTIVTLVGGPLGVGTSDFDWDGFRSQAPTNDVNNPSGYFDANNIVTWRGFHTFATPLEPTSYTNTAQGQPVAGGGVTLIGGLLGSTQFDWDGTRNQAPTNDINNPNGYFDQNNQSTWRGFHTFATPLEPTSYTNTGQGQPVAGGGVTLIGGPLGTTQFDWDGTRNQAPTNDANNPNGYFDRNNISTWRGFHTFATPLEATSYANTNQGQPITSGGVNITPGSTQFDWDGTDPYSMRATRFFGFTQGNRFGFMVNMSQFDGTAYPIINPMFSPNILGLQGFPQRVQRFALSTFRQLLQPLQTSNLEQYAPLSFGGKSISGFKATLDNQSPVVNVQKYGFNITGFRRRGKSSGQLVDLTTGAAFLINPSIVVPFMDVNRYTLGGGIDSRPTYVDGEMAVWANTGNPNTATQPFSTIGANGLTAAQVVALNRSFNGLPYYNGVLYKSHIDYQYSKYNLVRDSFNTSTTYPQPFIDTSLNGEDKDLISSLRAINSIPNSVNLPGTGTIDLSSIKNNINSAISFLDSAQSFDEGIVRGGLVKNVVRSILDTKRITKFLLSPKGLLWNAKQIGLQFMNPMVDTGTGLLGIAGATGLPGGVLGINWTNIYNPLSVPLNTFGRNAVINTRFARHGVLMYGEGAYEDIAVTRQLNTDNRDFEDFTSPGFFNRTSDYNRLVSLTKELLPDSYKPIVIVDNNLLLENGAPQLNSGGGVRQKLKYNVNSSTNLPQISTDTKIQRLSTIFGGPNSFLGLFGTTINRATHPYKGINSTGYFPTKESIEKGTDREVFFSPTSVQDNLVNTGNVFQKSINKYGDLILSNASNPGNPLDRNNDFNDDAYVTDEEFGGTLVALKNYIQKIRKTYSSAGASRRMEGANPYETPAPVPYGIQKATARRLYEKGFEQWKHPNPSDRVRDTTKTPSFADIADKTGFLDTAKVIQNDHSPIKNYKTSNYSGLVRSEETFDAITDTTKLQDFRSGLEADNSTRTFSSSPKVINFKNNNLEDRFGIGSEGEPGNLRSEVYVSTIQYTSLIPSGSGGTGIWTENADGSLTLKDSAVMSNYKYAAYPTLKKDVTEQYRKKLLDMAKKNGTAESLVFKVPKFRGDRINIIDWKRSTTDLSSKYVYEQHKNAFQDGKGDSVGAAEDLVQFYFTGANLKGSEYKPTEAIVFRAYIDTIVDNHKPSWTPIKYIGRADPVYSYDGYERDINFGFTVHIGTRDELKASWRKLNMLASWTAPEYTDNGFMKAPVVRLNLGNLYRKFPGFLSTLTYTFDNTQTTWETAKLREDWDFSKKDAEGNLIKALSMPGALELPKTINVQCTFVTFNIYRPEWDCVFYSLFDDRSEDGSLETGLVPVHGDRVNYFRTFDDLPLKHPMNTGLCAIVDLTEKKPKPEEKKQETKPEPAPKKPVEKYLCGINFCTDEDRYVTDSSNAVIDQLANWMLNDCKNSKITLVGHASQEVDFKLPKEKDAYERYALYNMKLSNSRATTVKNLLIAKGVDENRIQSRGAGITSLIQGIPPSDAKNRRIEIILENQDQAGCDVKLVVDPKKATGCPAVTSCSRKEIGDKSEFWLVGPQYFTHKFVPDTGIGGIAVIPEEYKAFSEQVDGEWWIADGGVSWRTKWATKGNRVRGYDLSTTSATSRYKTPVAGSPNNFGAYTYRPRSAQPVDPNET
jgi:outer membrane protein OmpA-like peptidoglycan-associated protein